VRVILAQQVGKQALIVEMKLERIFSDWLRNSYGAPPQGDAPASRSAASGRSGGSLPFESNHFPRRIEAAALV
jgi:hypothetical protein